MWKASRILILVGGAGCWIGALSVSSCGGTSASADAGPDGTTTPDAQKEATADVAKDTQPPPCAVDADLNNLQFPDAAFDGGVNTAVCWSCLKGGCQTYISECNKTCDCKQGVVDFIDCMGQGGTINSCAAGLLAIDQTFALQFGTCAYTNCKTQCGLPDFGDASLDAPDGG